VLRGGSFNNNENNLRAANRNRNTPDNRNDNNGFRLVSSRSSTFTGTACRVHARLAGRGEERRSLSLAESGASRPGE
jgi:hypothetical protein